MPMLDFYLRLYIFRKGNLSEIKILFRLSESMNNFREMAKKFENLKYE